MGHFLGPSHLNTLATTTRRSIIDPPGALETRGGDMVNRCFVLGELAGLRQEMWIGRGGGITHPTADPCLDWTSTTKAELT